jgi:hypothetical protein
VHINVTMRPDNFDRTLDEARALRAAMPAASITLKPLRVGFDTELFDYTQDQLDMMSAGLPQAAAQTGTMPRGTMTALGNDGTRRTIRATEFVVRGENRWRGYRCNAGLESLRVIGAGGITRAVCAAGGEIGRLGGPITLPTAPILCPASVCACTADILITKARPRSGTGMATAVLPEV